MSRPSIMGRPLTAEERRVYKRAYNRAIARQRDRVDHVLKIARAYRDANEVRDQWRCDTCLRWTRGCPTCKWGTCSASFEWGTEPAMWSENRDATISTHQEFSCCNWLPVPPVKE